MLTDEEIYCFEVNPNPDISPDTGAARAIGQGRVTAEIQHAAILDNEVGITVAVGGVIGAGDVGDGGQLRVVRDAVGRKRGDNHRIPGRARLDLDVEGIVRRARAFFPVAEAAVRRLARPQPVPSA